MKKKITICIPTFNRTNLLLNLIDTLNSQILNNFEELVNILIIDNSENIETEIALSNLNFNNIRYIHNNKNLGFDLNILKLYLNSNSEFIWFFGDDDFPEPNSIENLINICNNYNPDILLLPFRQPIDIEIPQFQKFPEIIELKNSDKALNLILGTGKITSYLIKKIDFDNNSIENISKFDGTGWMHLVICLQLMYLNNKCKILTYNNFCANCRSDKDIENLQWVPIAFINFQKLLNHEIFNKIKTGNSTKIIFDDVYKNGIIINAYGSSGIWNVYNKNDYVLFGKSFPFKKCLFFSPFYLLLWLLLKSGSTNVIKKVLIIYLFLKKFIKN